MSRPTIRLATAVFAAGLLAVAAAGTALAQSPTAPMASGPAPRVVAMEIGAGSIEPASVDVLKGETVTFEATNVSDTEVELIVGLKTEVDADSGDSLTEAEHIAPGTMKSVTFTFDGDGPYAYGDQVGDHYAAGAKGDIVLVDQLSVPSPAASPAGRVVTVTIAAGCHRSGDRRCHQGRDGHVRGHQRQRHRGRAHRRDSRPRWMPTPATA